MNWIIVSIFLFVAPFFRVRPQKKSPRAPKKIIFWGKKKTFFFINFLAELDHSKTFFFSKKKIFFWGVVKT